LDLSPKLGDMRILPIRTANESVMKFGWDMCDIHLSVVRKHDQFGTKYPLHSKVEEDH